MDAHFPRCVWEKSRLRCVRGAGRKECRRSARVVALETRNDAFDEMARSRRWLLPVQMAALGDRARRYNDEDSEDDDEDGDDVFGALDESDAESHEGDEAGINYNDLVIVPQGKARRRMGAEGGAGAGEETTTEAAEVAEKRADRRRREEFDAAALVQVQTKRAELGKSLEEACVPHGGAVSQVLFAQMKNMDGSILGNTDLIMKAFEAAGVQGISFGAGEGGAARAARGSVSTPEFEKGMKAEAKYRADEDTNYGWHVCWIMKKTKKSGGALTYDVKYDDGFTEQNVRAENVRHPHGHLSLAHMQATSAASLVLLMDTRNSIAALTQRVADLAGAIKDVGEKMAQLGSAEGGAVQRRPSARGFDVHVLQKKVEKNTCTMQVCVCACAGKCVCVCIMPETS